VREDTTCQQRQVDAAKWSSAPAFDSPIFEKMTQHQGHQIAWERRGRHRRTSVRTALVAVRLLQRLE